MLITQLQSGIAAGVDITTKKEMDAKEGILAFTTGCCKREKFTEEVRLWN